MNSRNEAYHTQKKSLRSLNRNQKSFEREVIWLHIEFLTHYELRYWQHDLSTRTHKEALWWGFNRITSVKTILQRKYSTILLRSIVSEPTTTSSRANCYVFRSVKLAVFSSTASKQKTIQINLYKNRVSRQFNLSEKSTKYVTTFIFPPFSDKFPFSKVQPFK